PKYKVTTTADKHTDFSRLKTYVWETGWASYDRTAHDQIVAAVDRELASLGFTKGTEGHTDVTVVYASVRRTDVNLKSKTRGPDGERPTFPVATLVVLVREPGTNKELFRARSDTPIALESKTIEATIDHEVARMFARYPTRRSSHQ
ncbi:MAG TPA: DUF4136 domain-containing protein, partial [Vicinamibacterales bacterium]